jgi:hypothetical protein
MDGGRGRGICLDGELDGQGGVPVRALRGEDYSGTAHYPAPRDPVSYRFSASPAEFNIVRVGLNYKFGGHYEAPLSEAPLK